MTPKTITELQQELPILEEELASCVRLVASINQLSANLQTMTTAHALGSVTADQLLKAQQAHADAVQAIARKDLLTQSVQTHRQMINFAMAQEKRQFLDKISSDFASTRARYQIESKKLLDIFKEMHRLHTVSLSMRSHQLMTDADYRLDLPALRSPNDSDLFTVGSMVRGGEL